MANALVTVISAQTTAKTAAYDSSGGDMGCALLISAGPLGSGETIEIATAGSASNCLLFHDGVQVVLSPTNPSQQVSVGPTYVFIKPITASACAVDVCKVGRR